uniref:PG1828 family lipoprotein n=1 Tax=Prevotella sp. TaxID=59823 RepID=UPI003FF11A3D
MKKLVLMFVAIAAISFASCGNKTAATEATADTDTVAAVDTTVADTAAVDTTVAE